MTKTSTFYGELLEIERVLEDLSTGSASKIMAWTLQSASFSILKEIKQPEAIGGWPVDTGTSRRRWGFKKAKIKGEMVTFEIFNDATVNEQRAARGAAPLSRKGHNSYAKWVYRKGDALLRRPIAPEIVKRAIISVAPSIEKTFNRILSNYLKKRGLSI